MAFFDNAQILSSWRDCKSLEIKENRGKAGENVHDYRECDNMKISFNYVTSYTLIINEEQRLHSLLFVKETFYFRIN